MKIGKVEFTTSSLLVGVLALLVIVFCGYVFYRVFASEHSLISFMMVPLILGIVFENKRLSSDWLLTGLKVSGALLLSLLSFLPGRKELEYSFEAHIEGWPYWFIFFFVLISMIVHEKRIMPKLTEGITLLQSISIIYWVIDIGLFEINNLLVYVPVSVGLFYCVISFVHAFTYLKLTRKDRQYLSIWSSVIMIVFAADHIYKVFTLDHFSDFELFDTGLNALQHFLLGISLIYILQNAMMLLVYLPTKDSWYGKKHMREIKEVHKQHADRYSTKQVKRSDAFLALIFATGIYALNYQVQFMPRNTLIWLLFWTFPFVVHFKEQIRARVNSRTSP